ncbi:MAG: alpha-amlyase [Thermoprotei archaeon]|nr:MAG: alpha-amlyase [Thermoprotei archaeon]
MVQYVAIFLEMHQPRRISGKAFQKLVDLLSLEHISEETLIENIFDEDADRETILRIVENSYRPVLDIVLSEEMKISLSISGILLELLKKHNPEVINILGNISKQGLIEFLCEPYYHSLAMFAGEDVVLEELKLSRENIKNMFGVEPRVVFNTEGLYNDQFASTLERIGFKAVVTEGVERVLGWRSPTFLYSTLNGKTRILLRHGMLSEDVALRFGDMGWCCYPLTADKYARWMKGTPGEFVIIGLDVETFGEYFSKETGILEFLKWLPRELRNNGLELIHTSEIIEYFDPVDELMFETTVSWTNGRDESAWLGNEMQKLAFTDLINLKRIFKESGCLRLWHMFLTSDYFYYMSNKPCREGMGQHRFDPYKNPYKAFKHFIETLKVATLVLQTHL